MRTNVNSVRVIFLPTAPTRSADTTVHVILDMKGMDTDAKVIVLDVTHDANQFLFQFVMQTSMSAKFRPSAQSASRMQSVGICRDITPVAVALDSKGMARSLVEVRCFELKRKIIN